MLARVTTFEGGTPDGLRAGVEQLRSDAQSGRAMFIGLFASEEDLRESEPALDAMSPPEGAGTRSSVDLYEVGVDVRM